MYERFSNGARDVMRLANQEAQRFNHEYIGTEHILLGLLKVDTGVAATVLKILDIDLPKVCRELDKIIQSGTDRGVKARLPQTPRAKKVVEYAIEEAGALHHDYVGTEHVLLGLLREGEGVAAQVLLNLGLKLHNVRQVVLNVLNTCDAAAGCTGNLFSKTLLLDQLGRDLTALAEQGKLDPLVGCRGSLQALVEVLCCRQRNNAVLIGAAGVGKTAIVTGLAHAIVGGGVPAALDGCRLIELSLSRMLGQSRDQAGTNFQQALLNEIRGAGNIVFFLPEELRLLAASQGGSVLHALQLIHNEWFNALARGELRCIFEGSADDYEHGIGRHDALHRCSQAVHVPPATLEETIAVLQGLRHRLESHHHVRFADDAIAIVAGLADQQLPGALPAKALVLFDRAGARGQRRGAQASREVRQLAARLGDEIERLSREKENAVAQHEFDRAGELRDRALQLKAERDAMLVEEIRLRNQHGGTVDTADVAETLRVLLGGTPAPDQPSHVTAIRCGD
jgi:ATP-dependent Clp protease ATP-binding subunit ClpC